MICAAFILIGVLFSAMAALFLYMANLDNRIYDLEERLPDDEWYDGEDEEESTVNVPPE